MKSSQIIGLIVYGWDCSVHCRLSTLSNSHFSVCLVALKELRFELFLFSYLKSS